MTGEVASSRGTGRAGRHWLLLPWLALSGACLWLMWESPEAEVVPFHLIWIGFALAYGFGAWPLVPTFGLLGVVTVASGAILVERAAQGAIAWEETTEIPLMLLLAALVVVHVRRRETALATVTRLARRDVLAAREREQFSRLTSHEMRTPLTIASGYVDLLLHQEADPLRRGDLAVVSDELGRLSRAGDRLIRMMQLQDRARRGSLDVDALVQETAHRWAAVAARQWSVESDGGVLDASGERLRAGLDTLIENALRYTTDGGSVRLSCFRQAGLLFLGVADSGPGLSADQAERINGQRPHVLRNLAAPGAPDPRSQSGLGIGIVEDVARAHGGRVVAGRSREGGALVMLALPVVAAPVTGAAPAARSA